MKAKRNSTRLLWGGLLLVLLVLSLVVPALNVRAAETADCTVTVMKVLKDSEGNELDVPDGEFEFELFDPSGKSLGTAKANDKGFAKFELKGLTEADSGEYTVKEVKKNESKYTYDTDKKVTITVGNLTTYENNIGAAGQNAEAGNSEAMQHYKLYDGIGEEVNYTHGEVIAGDGVSFKMITDGDGNSYHAFCMVRHLSASDSDFPTRARYKGDSDNGNGTGGTWLDAVRDLNNAWNSENGAPDNNTYASGLLTIMWNGYPHNASGFMESYGLSKEEFYQVTQHVIYAFGRYGGEYTNIDSAPDSFKSNPFRTKAANTELFDKLYNAACIAGQGWVDGVSLSVPYVEGDQVSVTYVHWTGTEGQPLLSSWVKGTPTTKFQATATSATFENTVKDDTDPSGDLKTTVSAAGKTGSADAAAELTADDVTEAISVTDKIEYTGLTAGATYVVSGKLMEVENKQATNEIASAKIERPAEDGGSGTWDMTFDNVKLEEGKTYVVFEYAVNKDNPDDKASHENPEDLSQTIIVSGGGAAADVTVEISKVDLNGTELPGAQIQILDADGKVVEEWTSTSESHKISLAPGTYTFHEVAAPNGYKVVTDIKFSVYKNGDVEILGDVDIAVATSGNGLLKITDETDDSKPSVAPASAGATPKTGDAFNNAAAVAVCLAGLASVVGALFLKKEDATR